MPNPIQHGMSSEMFLTKQGQRTHVGRSVAFKAGALFNVFSYSHVARIASSFLLEHYLNLPIKSRQHDLI